MSITLEKLLRTKIKGVSPVSGEAIEFFPEYRVSVQKETEEGVHIIIHANSYNSATLDLLVSGDTIKNIGV